MIKDIFKEHNVELMACKDVDNFDNPLIVSHLTHDSGAEWYIIAGDYIYNDNELRDIFLFGVCKIFDYELGHVSLSELLSVDVEWDNNWDVKGLYDVFPEFK